MKTPRQAKKISDLLVVGGGASGLTMALAAAQAGFRVALADGGALAGGSRADTRSYAIAPASMRLFAALGLGGALDAAAQPVRRMAIGDAPPGVTGKSLIRLDFEERDVSAGDGAPLAFIIESRRLLEVLAAAVRADTRIDVLPNSPIEGIDQIPGAAEVRFADGSGAFAQLMIGADGRSSSVRDICAVGVTEWGYQQTGIAAALTHEKTHEAVAYDLFSASGPIGVLPLRGNRSSIVWCEAPEAAAALMKLAPEDFCAELSHRLDGRLGKLSLEGERSAFPLAFSVAETMIAPRAALIADAAHSLHPLAGQGLNIGLRDIAALAEVLADARALGLDIGAETTLERYQRWRRFDNLSYALSMDALNRVFGWRVPSLRLLRDAGLALTNAASPVRRLLAKEAAGLSEAAPRLLRGEPVRAG
jgi:2-octaprenyl-6-methoxyphenol hydroxylase